MNDKVLIHLLKRVLVLLGVMFVIFIVFINVLKVLDFVIKTDRVIKSVRDNEEIRSIESQFVLNESEANSISNPKRAKTASEIGFVDKFELLNGTEWGEGFNILIIGSDKKNFQESRSRSDVIILLRINKNGKILSLSIPRDTLITINNGKHTGEKDKIGHSLYWGGLDNMKKSVEDLLGCKIDRTLILDNFKSFEAMIAILGGVNVDQFLDGKLSVRWIRNRHFPFGDIERCRRQQLFLEKIIQKGWKISRSGNYYYSMMLFEAMRRVVFTDMEKADFLKLLYLLKMNQFKPAADFYNCVLPGEFARYDSSLMNRKNVTCWIPDPVGIEKFRFLFYSSRSEMNILDNSRADLLSFIKLDIKIYLEKDRKISKKFVFR